MVHFFVMGTEIKVHINRIAQGLWMEITNQFLLMTKISISIILYRQLSYALWKTPDNSKENHEENNDPVDVIKLESKIHCKLSNQELPQSWEFNEVYVKHKSKGNKVTYQTPSMQKSPRSSSIQRQMPCQISCTT